MQRPTDRVVVIKGKWCPTDVVKINVSSEIFSEFNLKKKHWLIFLFLVTIIAIKLQV